MFVKNIEIDDLFKKDSEKFFQLYNQKNQNNRMIYLFYL